MLLRDLDRGGRVSIGRVREVVEHLSDTGDDRANTLREKFDDRSKDLFKVHE